MADISDLHAPILDRLRAQGYDVGSLADLRASGRRYRGAIGLLLEELDKADDERLLVSIVQALSVPWARPEATMPLIELFRTCADRAGGVMGLPWAVGNALEVVWDDAHFDELVAIVRERRFGRAREMVALGLGRSQRPEAPLVLTKLLDDPEVAGHAAQALLKLRVPEDARGALEALRRDQRAWVQRTARRAMSRLDAQDSDGVRQDPDGGEPSMLDVRIDGSGVEAQIIDRLRALRRFDLIAPVNVVEWAQERTETGEFTQLLFELSELRPALAADVDEYLARLAEQEGLTEPSDLRAAELVVGATAEAVEAGTMTPRAAARRLSDLTVRVPLLTGHLSAFISLAAEWDELPEGHPTLDAAAVAEVRRVALDIGRVIVSLRTDDGRDAGLVVAPTPIRTATPPRPRYRGTPRPLSLSEDVVRALSGEKPAMGLDGRPVVQPWAVGPGRIVAIVCAVVGLGLAFVFPPMSIALGALALILANTAWAHLKPADPRRPLTVWGQILAGASVIGGVIGVIVWFSLR